MNSLLDFKFITHTAQVDQQSWDKLAVDAGPFLQYSFINALEESASVGENTGWQPQHLVIYQQNIVVGLLPLYIKHHSYGEYVFDFAWANTYRQYGLNYYPKLVAAIPFTPVTGQRLLLDESLDHTQVMPKVLKAIQQQIKMLGLSSMHWLFLEQPYAEQLAKHNQQLRRSVQFQWFNRDYQDFSDFLNALTSRKRKAIKKERANIHQQGIIINRLTGEQITSQAMDNFYLCYQQTYLKRSGHKGYLSEAFFKLIFETMKDKILLVEAVQNGNAVAASLFFVDDKQLAGRYWGALEDIDALHFECCYYQGIEFCIENKIASFNPGTQGEHKLLRGFEPIYCYSNHWLKESAFHDAVARYMQQESETVAHYKEQASKLLPYKNTEFSA